VKYHWIITWQTPTPTGFVISTRDGIMTLPPASTHRDAYDYLMREVVHANGSSSVLFFALEPDDLGAAS
jgi:hypothetical protein